MIPIEDDRLEQVWGEHLTRLIFRVENPPQRDTWTLRFTPYDI